MNNIFQEKRNTFLLLIGLLFVLLIVLYFAFISPLLSDFKGKKASQVSLQNDIAVLEKQLEQLADVQEEFEQEQLELQKKIPLTRELEEIVLILQDMELQSSSLIESIDFYYDSSLPTSDFLYELDSDEVIEDEDSSVVEGVENDDEASRAIDLNEKPESLQIITIRMDISSPTYDDFLHFITEIEQQERIMSVSGLHFEKTSEEGLVLAEELDETITYQVELITFYYQD